jgi:hypothetical protein
MVFVEDLKCRLDFFMSGINFEAVEWVPGVVAVNWCLLLVAGWYGGFCGVRVTEALACCSLPFLVAE